MYSRITIDEVEERDVDDERPTLRAIGYELRPEQMRPNVWEYEAGESNVSHRQDEQEELYVVLDGRFDVTIERDGEREVLELSRHDCLVVPPESWRQLEAREESTLLVVGSPNVKDDGIVDE